MNIGDLLMGALIINLIIIGLVTFFITTIGYFTIKFWNLILGGIEGGIKTSFRISPIVSLTIIIAFLVGGIIIYKNPDNFKILYNQKVCMFNINGNCYKYR